MRKIDRWCGVPACFVASLWLRLRGRRAGPASPRRILFVGLAEIGALVLAHGAIQRARRRFPDAELYFLTFETGREAVGLLGFDAAHTIVLRPSSAGRLARDTLGALRRCRRLGIDASVNFETFVRFSTLLAALSGARRRVGFHPFHAAGQYLGSLLTHRVNYSAHHHAAQSYAALVAALGEAGGAEPCGKVPAEECPTERLRIPDDPARAAALRAELLAGLAPAERPAEPRFVVLNANASDLVPLRRWPAARYAALGRRLLEDRRVVLVLTGVAAEREAADELAGRIGGGRILNLAGRTTLRELIGLYQACDLLVTNDSGPAHLASTTDIATIVLFGPETPAIFGPIGPRQEAIWLGLACSPCVSVYNQKRSACTDNVCMQGIEVERVLQRARALLDGARPASAA